jgi:hypothetical protein
MSTDAFFKTQIKNVLQNFVSELKIISGYKPRPSITSSTFDADFQPDSACTTIGIGSTELDSSPVEILQKYFIQQGAGNSEKGPGWLRLENSNLEFFSIPTQSQVRRLNKTTHYLVENFVKRYQNNLQKYTGRSL